MIHNRAFSAPLMFLAVSVFICVHLWILSAPADAQDATAMDQEVAVNLTEGRIVICATKDAILLAATDEQDEPGSRPPVITALSATRIGVILGATEWLRPDSDFKPIELDSEFTKLVGAALNYGGEKPDELSATDVESIGVSLLERIRLLAGLLHHKVNLGEDEPLIRLVIAGYVRDYGPEAWVIDYHIAQDPLRGGLWRTRVLRPSYNQVYPPEKGKPKTLMEVRYPPEDRAKGQPELLDLLQQNDSRVASLRAVTDEKGKSVTLAVEGQSQKSDGVALTNFLKVALPAVTPPGTKLTMAKVEYDGGFQWILQPPKAPPPPPGQKADTKEPEEPERPTLLHKPGN